MNDPLGPKPRAIPAHLADPAQYQALKERVQQKYGAFGAHEAEEDPEDVERRVLADDWRKPTLQIIAGVFVASLVASFLSHPTFPVPGTWANSFRVDSLFVVVWGPLLFFAMSRVKLWKSLRIYLVLALFIEPFSEAMFREMGLGDEQGYWDTVMWPAGVAFFGTLKEFAGVPGASFGVFTLCTVGLLYRGAVRRASGMPAPPKFARNALLGWLAAILVFAGYGVATGGQVDWTFRQTIYMLQTPIVALVFLYALRVPDDLAFIGTAYVCAAAARALLVAFVYFGICMPKGITSLPGKPEWCTNHSDTVLFVTALIILVANAFEHRGAQKTLMRSLGLGLVILAGVALNNRRLAFVSLASAPLVLYLALKPSRRKRRITSIMAILVPLAIIYVLVGSELASSSPSPLLKPAKLVMSVLDQKDTSSQSRDIENENLIYTLKESPLLTRGFGFEYDYSPNNPPVDLGDVFKNYRIIAHNGVLWLWSIAGVLGFTVVWLVYPLAGTLAVRGYRAAPSPLERSAALAALGAVVVCVIQVWGDQGFNSYMTLVTFGVAFAVATRIAAREG